MTETQALAEFGKKTCDVPGYTDCWVTFKTSGYPRKLRAEWQAADNEATWAIVTRYATDWHLRDLNNQDVPFATDYHAVDLVEDAVIAWVIRAFSRLWLVELTAPRPNS